VIHKLGGEVNNERMTRAAGGGDSTFCYVLWIAIFLCAGVGGSVEGEGGWVVAITSLHTVPTA